MTRSPPVRRTALSESCGQISVSGNCAAHNRLLDGSFPTSANFPDKRPTRTSAPRAARGGVVDDMWRFWTSFRKEVSGVASPKSSVRQPRLPTVIGKCYPVNSIEVHIDGCYTRLIVLGQAKESDAEKAPELPAPGLRGLTHSEQRTPEAN